MLPPVRCACNMLYSSSHGKAAGRESEDRGKTSPKKSGGLMLSERATTRRWTFQSSPQDAYSRTSSPSFSSSLLQPSRHRRRGDIGQSDEFGERLRFRMESAAFGAGQTIVTSEGSQICKAPVSRRTADLSKTELTRRPGPAGVCTIVPFAGIGDQTTRSTCGENAGAQVAEVIARSIES